MVNLWWWVVACVGALCVIAGNYLVGQSMDNTIVTYDGHKFRQNTKKTFKGHMSAGFGCQVGFSPNGR
jgi:pre-mRNA-processing factor 17